MKTPCLIAALAIGMSLTGVATTPATADPIRIVNVSGYVVLDRQHLILRGGASRAYLVTLQRRCWGLREGYQLGTSFHGNERINNPRFEYITTGDDRCYIDTIEEVENVAEARELIESRADDNS